MDFVLTACSCASSSRFTYSAVIVENYKAVENNFFLIVSILIVFLCIKVRCDSLLIHELSCSLSITLCSVTSNMTGYSHSYHSIKLIRYGAPQRDVLSDKMVLWAATHSFCFMLCHASLLSTVISFLYKDKWWFHKSMSVWKILENYFIPFPH